MKYLVLSDIHGNLDALDAVLAPGLAEAGGVLCLGDTVGYGPEPSECIARLREISAKGLLSACVLGNHDAGVCGSVPAEWFNGVARFALDFTRKLLAPADFDWLKALPEEAAFREGCLAVHGSPLERVTGYLFGGQETEDALISMEERGIRSCFVGHTHTPAYFERGSGRSGAHPAPGTVWRESRNLMGRILGMQGVKRSAIFNPGSVGFPRSRPEETDPADYPAEYAVWDSEAMTVEFREARYDRCRFEGLLAKIYDSVK